MATIKSFTDLQQSKKLAKILPLESADYHYIAQGEQSYFYEYSLSSDAIKDYDDDIKYIPCWSLAALLKYLSKIKPQVYTPVLFPSEGKWILQFVEYSHGNVCEVSYDNPVDACYEMILKLKEQNLLLYDCNLYLNFINQCIFTYSKKYISH